MSKHVSTSEANLELVDEFNTTIFADNDFSRLGEFIAEDARHLEGGDVQFEGIDAFRTYFEDMLADWDGLEMDVVSIVADDDRVVYNFSMNGTAVEDLTVGEETYDAAGKSFNWDGFVSLTIEDGMIVESTLLTDEASILRQLGVLPARAA